MDRTAVPPSAPRRKSPRLSPPRSTPTCGLWAWCRCSSAWTRSAAHSYSRWTLPATTSATRWGWLEGFVTGADKTEAHHGLRAQAKPPNSEAGGTRQDVKRLQALQACSTELA